MGDGMLMIAYDATNRRREERNGGGGGGGGGGGVMSRPMVVPMLVGVYIL